MAVCSRVVRGGNSRAARASRIQRLADGLDDVGANGPDGVGARLRRGEAERRCLNRSLRGKPREPKRGGERGCETEEEHDGRDPAAQWRVGRWPLAMIRKQAGGRQATRQFKSVCGVWAVGSGRWVPDDAGLGEATRQCVACGRWAVGA